MDTEIVKPKVYLETTVLSYLTAWPSRDLIRAAHQQITQEGWARRERFEIFVSQAVLREAARGDAKAAAERLDAVHGLQVLAVTDEAEALAELFMERCGLPPKAAVDALHVAIAAVNGMD